MAGSAWEEFADLLKDPGLQAEQVVSRVLRNRQEALWSVNPRLPSARKTGRDLPPESNQDGFSGWCGC